MLKCVNQFHEWTIQKTETRIQKWLIIILTSTAYTYICHYFYFNTLFQQHILCSECIFGNKGYIKKQIKKIYFQRSNGMSDSIKFISHFLISDLNVGAVTVQCAQQRFFLCTLNCAAESYCIYAHDSLLYKLICKHMKPQYLHVCEINRQMDKMNPFSDQDIYIFSIL